jgi:hypothetical protein
VKTFIFVPHFLHTPFIIFLPFLEVAFLQLTIVRFALHFTQYPIWPDWLFPVWRFAD